MRWFKLSTSLCFLALGEGAVIEVTAGGAVSEPTYQFSDSSGSSLATLTGASDKITASTDLETGSGNRVDDLAARLAAAEALIQKMAQLEFGSGVALTTTTTCTMSSTYSNGYCTGYNDDVVQLLTIADCKNRCLASSTCLAIMYSGGTPVQGNLAKCLLCTSSAFSSHSGWRWYQKSC